MISGRYRLHAADKLAGYRQALADSGRPSTRA